MSEYVCLVCGDPLPPRRRTYCGNDCYRKSQALRPAHHYRTNPEVRRKQLARMKAYYHVKEIGPCEDCGSTERIERHHMNYDEPLNVTFRCRACHARLHRKERAA